MENPPNEHEEEEELVVAGVHLEEAKNSPEFYEQLEMMLKDPNTGDIPTQRILEAKRVADQKRRRTAQYREIPLNWEERGPDNIGGRTRCFLYDANDPTKNTAFVGSVSGGLWKTTNLSSDNPAWVNIDDFFSTLAINSVVQDPTNLNTMYFATGETFGNGGRGLGVWKSTDGGNTWNQLASTNNPGYYYINRMVIDAQGDLYLSLNIGAVQKSTDGGNTWQTILGNSSGRSSDIEIASNGTIYAILNSNPSGIYKSTNGGQDWTIINNGLSGNTFGGRTEITSSHSNPDLLLIYFCTGSRLYRTTNGGANWNEINTLPNLGTQCGWDITLGIDPFDDNSFMVGKVSMVLTRDGGTTWKYGGNHADHHVSYFDPDRQTMW